MFLVHKQEQPLGALSERKSNNVTGCAIIIPMTFWLLKTLAFIDFFPRALAAGGTGSNDSGSGTSIKLDNPIGCDDFQCVMTKVTSALLMLSIPIVTIMVLWGGFQILTAGGSKDRLEVGKKTILYAAVGFVVVLLANSVANVLQDIFKP